MDSSGGFFHIAIAQYFTLKDAIRSIGARASAALVLPNQCYDHNLPFSEKELGGPAL